MGCSASIVLACMARTASQTPCMNLRVYPPAFGQRLKMIWGQAEVQPVRSLRTAYMHACMHALEYYIIKHAYMPDWGAGESLMCPLMQQIASCLPGFLWVTHGMMLIYIHVSNTFGIAVLLLYLNRGVRP